MYNFQFRWINVLLSIDFAQYVYLYFLVLKYLLNKKWNEIKTTKVKKLHWNSTTLQNYNVLYGIKHKVNNEIIKPFEYNSIVIN